MSEACGRKTLGADSASWLELFICGCTGWCRSFVLELLKPLPMSIVDATLTFFAQRFACLWP